jgi:ribosomal protein L12E/L44/L45/RPP1/RPP2
MSNPVGPELQAKIASWRAKSAVGELTIEEMKDAIIHLRAGRTAAASASSASATKRKKAVAAIPKAEDMLGELLGG